MTAAPMADATPSYESTLSLPSGSSPFSLPLAHPDPSTTPAPARPEHTPAQAQMLDKLIAHFNQPGFALPKTLKDWHTKNDGPPRGLTSYFRRAAPVAEEEVELEPLNDVEKCYWSNEAFQRCLRACKWNYDDAKKRAEITCVWRRDFNTEGLGAKEVSKEGETGKEIVMGYDVNQRPVLYMHPYRQNTETNPSQIDFVVWCLERTIDLCPATVPVTDMLCLCIDLGSNRSDSKGQPTPPSVAKKVLDILQTYYCERLGRAICINVPTVFWVFYKIVGPFVDPVTKDKIRFLNSSDATELVPKSQLQSMFGGDINFEYDHSVYFDALTKLCNERKAANLERWRKYGDGKCGLSEAVIKGAVVPGGAKEGGEVKEGEIETKAETEDSKKTEEVDEVAKGVEGVNIEA
ncbi:CRAL/TRIO domain-containing protein [Pseudohyphozyma bogoriensis]|nr:CRAL/TRIO domain-containing protein [Pseudohyphozyma bogoriensis]